MVERQVQRQQHQHAPRREQSAISSRLATKSTPKPLKEVTTRMWHLAGYSILLVSRSRFLPLALALGAAAAQRRRSAALKLNCCNAGKPGKHLAPVNLPD